MAPSPEMTETTMSTSEKTRPRKEHWAVRMNHRNRTWGFLALWLMIAMHIAQKFPTWQEWALLSATYLLYPQMVWLVTRRSSRPVPHEIMCMRIDSLLCGIWTAALHFPIWISFTLCISVLVSLTLFHGLRGLFESALSWLLGGALVVAFTGWNFQPQTEWSVTWTALCALSLYLLATALDNHKRSMRLHETRQELKARELDLQKQIQEINALQTLLKEQALSDPLTGLYNRHRLNEVLAREGASSMRSLLPMSLVLIDVDHFKGINDRLGHQIGDEVLRQIASHLQAYTRASDWCFRYGGEEFLLVLPETTLDDARKKADALRQSLAARPMVFGDAQVDVTISAGLACFPNHGTDMDSLIGAADKALYRAKNQGRNRVLTFSEITPASEQLFPVIQPSKSSTEPGLPNR